MYLFKLLTLLLILYTSIGFFVLPTVLKQTIEEKLSSEFNSSVNIQNLELNPLNLELVINKFNLKSSDNSELISINSISTQLNFISILNEDIDLNYLDIEQAKVFIKRFENGNFNFTKYIQKKQQKKDVSKHSWPILINNIQITDTSVEYIDKFINPSFTKTLKSINIKMKNVVIDSNSQAEFRLSSLSLKKEKLNINGTINIDKKLNANIDINMDSIVLEDYKTYIEKILKNFTLSGKLSGSANFIINEKATNALQIKSIKIDNTDLTVIDTSTVPNINVPFKNISLKIIEKTPNSIFSISLDSKIENRYPIHLDGTFNIQKRYAHIFSDLTLPLPMFWAYTSDILNARLIDATATSKMNLDINSSSTIVNGELTIKSINLEHSLLNEKILDLEEISLKPMSLDFTNNAYKIEEISLSGLNIFLNKNENENFNIDTLFKDKSSKEKPKEKIAIDFKTINLNNGSLNYKDLNVKPIFSSEITDIKANVQDFSTNSSVPSKLNLSANINGNAFIDITSTFLPFHNSSNVNAYIANMDIVSLSGYSSKFLGYSLEKGKVNLNLDYTLKESKLLGKSYMNFDNLKVKELQNVKGVKKPPLSLAVALLKDRGEQINLDVDIDGDTAEPSFSVNGLISRIIINLIANIVTSPFAIIGSILGDSSDFSFVSFAPGKSTLNKKSMKTIVAIETALYDHPNLSIEIKGESSKESDAKALAKVHLNELLRNEKYLTLLEKNKNLSFQSIRLNENNSQWLKSAYHYFKTDTPSNDVMTEYLLKKLNATDSELHFLAFSRAKKVRNELVKREKISASKMYLVGANANSTKSGVTFELK